MFQKIPSSFVQQACAATVPHAPAQPAARGCSVQQGRVAARQFLQGRLELSDADFDLLVKVQLFPAR